MDKIYESLVGVYSFKHDEYLTLDDTSTNLFAPSGYSPTEIRNKFYNQLIWMILPEDRPLLFTALGEQMITEEPLDITFRIRHKNGRAVLVLNRICRVVDENNVESFYGVMIDITKHKEYHRTVDKSMEQYQIILSQTENVTFELDLKKDTITFSERWKELFGYMPKTTNFIATLPANSHIHPADIPALLQAFNALKNGSSYRSLDIRISTGGRFVWFCCRATAVYDNRGQLSKIVGIILNIDETKKEASALQAKAECDSLTKLLNKATSKKQSIEYLSSYPNGAYCALLVIDLDNFKQVNDRFGHMFGDKVLLKASEAIKASFRSRDIVARIGGDEFMVLMKDISNQDLVKERCTQMLAAFQTLLAGENVDHAISCSIGVALSPHHATTFDELFKYADEAMYDAKKEGKNNFAIYSPKPVIYY